MDNKSAKHKKVPGGFLHRGLRLAQLTAKIGAQAAGHNLSKWVKKSKNDPEALTKYLESQASLLTNELGHLKGSVMKAGQLLSTYGEHFFPPQVNKILKSLQYQAPPLEWEELQKVLVRELGHEKLSLLEIEPQAHASASLGQVHRAKIKATGEELALKIQYPGVDKAIETDISFLRIIFQLTNLFPSGFKSQSVMNEIRQMLTQELDYCQEAEQTKWFYRQLQNENYIQIPRVDDTFSSRSVLATEFIDSISADDPQISSWSQEVRNQIGILFLQVYVRELFEWGRVQTDSHFGNYRIRLDQDGQPHLVLLDFGAVREISPTFQSSYQLMVSGAFHRQAEKVIAGGSALGFLQAHDPEELRQIFVELCFLLTEPFIPASLSGSPSPWMNAQGAYDWGRSDLPQRVARLGARMVSEFRLRTPPQEVIFIDRKLSGTFTFLNRLGAVIEARSIFSPYL